MLFKKHKLKAKLTWLVLWDRLANESETKKEKRPVGNG